MCSKVSVLVEIPEDQPNRTLKLTVGGISVLALLGLLVRFFVALPAPVAIDLVGVLFAALAGGWAGRSAVHARIHYFCPLPRGRKRRYRLALVSLLDLSFAAVWLAGAVLLLRDPNPLFTFVGAAAASVLVFLLSLWTLAAARAAGYPRGSEWIRSRYRCALEPGQNTWPGWILVKLIDLRSEDKKLSAFVSGTLALLLASMLLMASSTFA